MSCRPNDERWQFDDSDIPRKKGRWERIGVVFFGVVITVMMTFWTDKVREEDLLETPRKNWTHKNSSSSH